MVIEVSQLTLVSGGRRRLDDVSIRVQVGVTALVGFSGAGKTSLLNVLAGFERPDDGRVRMELPRQPGRLSLFWVPQSGGLWNHLTVSDHLTAVATPEMFEQLQISADEILTGLDLNHRRTALPAVLSQGERSRLAMARALASGAQVLLLDEPLSHVDPARRDGYWQLMRTLFARMQTTVLFASHEPDAVVRESGHVICMSAGKVVYAGVTRELYDHPPDRMAGEFLGRLNWFTTDQLPDWLDASVAGIQSIQDQDGVGIRPERISVVMDRQSGGDQRSGLEVVHSLFHGSRCETVLRNRQTNQQRSVLHESGDRELRPGDFVRLCVRAGSRHEVVRPVSTQSG